LGALAALTAGTKAASADAGGRLTIIEENDSLFFTSDKHYTQGLRFSYLTAPLQPGETWNAPFDWLSGPLPFFPSDGARERRIDWHILGQQFYTPRSLQLNPPDPRDRPYAGWLYTGFDLLQENGGNRLDSLELLAGVVGPAALGHQTQNDWHQFIDIGGGRGWGSQIHNEPALLVSYERRWRIGTSFGDGFGADVVPELGVTAGNVFTYGAAGGLLRFGRNLDADYGPARLRPGPSGTDFFDPARLHGRFGFYVFVGVEGRAVAHNIFLDGDTFGTSPHVRKKNFVADFTAGVSVFWSDVARLDIGLLTRTKEFYGQEGQDSYAGINVSFGF
jgi:hypothetical protein